MLTRVRNRKMGSGSPGLFVQFARAAVKRDHGCARFFGRHFDVLPTNPIAPARLQSLQRRFFCGEARGIMLSGDCAPRFAIGALSFSEHAGGESRRAVDGLADAANFDNVNSD